jgi:cytoskeleton protein RodZ
MAQGINMTTDVTESKKNIETTNDIENKIDTEIKNDMESTISAEETNDMESTISAEETDNIEMMDSTDTVEEPDPIDIELSIGQKLKDKRIELGLSERDVATSLKISIDQVGALEASNFDYFLSVTFARGFLKSYCRLLDLNQVEMLSAFDSKRANTESTIKPVDKVNKQTHLGDPIVIFISVVIVAVLAFLVFWWPTASVQSIISDEDLINETSEVAKVEEQVSEPVLTASSTSETEVDEAEIKTIPTNTNTTSANSTTAKPVAKNETAETNNPVASGLSAETVAILEEAGVTPDDVVRATKTVPSVTSEVQKETFVSAYKNDIEMTFGDDCWTEIRDGSGTILFSGVKTAGSTLVLTGDAPYRVVLGYSSGVSSLKYKGEEFDFSSFVRQDLARFELK